MNSEELGKILDVLFTNPERLPSLLQGMSKDGLAHCLQDILIRYANDVNSSSLRELITILKAGYEPQPARVKLGYNGKTSSGNPCEVKPVNIRSESGNKLNGGGNFSDFTHERLARYQEDNVVMLVSGFFDGRLMYILEFPFSHPALVERLRQQLLRYFTKKGRKPGQFLRSAQFSFKHYKDCPTLKIIYTNPSLFNYQELFTRDLFQFLRGRK